MAKHLEFSYRRAEFERYILIPQTPGKNYCLNFAPGIVARR